MKILLNNREEEFEADSMTVSSMLEIRKFTFRMRIVKINGELIPRDKYKSTLIHDGDNVQMLYLMSGG
ncbi:MAG: sulfur carrier protein ThiS [Bacteroidales bacterium]